MSYQVLARKWRPKSFDELVGQQQTARALINALESQRLHHAYLFTGTRGVGKTTIARILSKSLNCEKGITASPCGECSSCVEIDQGNFVDLMEIDAASKTKVEDTRELLENVQYRPSRGRYKVYLIDEVHMLSGHSFNALLKTLEEPPPHVVFLLATTDPQKLPVTVLSRCLQFHLKRMELQDIVDHLSMILTQEQIEFEPDSLLPIAKGADGSMRDALSLLDQGIAYSGNKLTLESVLEMLGAIDQSFCIELLDKVHQNDATGLMNTIASMSQYSPNFMEVMSDWLSLLHSIAVCQATSDSNSEEISRLANQVSPADLQLYYQLSLQAKRDMPYAPSPRQGFEMALLRVIAFRPQTSSPINAGSPASTGANASAADLSVKKKLSSKAINLAASAESSNFDEIATVETVVISANQVRNLEEHDLPETSISANNEAIKTIQEAPLPKSEISAQITSLRSNEAIADQQVETPEEFQSPQADSNVIPLNKGSLDQQEATREINAGSRDINYQDVGITDTSEAANNETLAEPTLAEPMLAEPESSVLGFIAPKNSLGRRLLYPNEKKLSIEEISPDSWHIAVDQSEIGGIGFQVLINALGNFSSDILTIEYLESVSEFLTANLTDTLKTNLRAHFQCPSLNVQFASVEKVNESPKEKQVKIHKAALESAFMELSDNKCFKGLEERIGASIDKQSIKMK